MVIPQNAVIFTLFFQFLCLLQLENLPSDAEIPIKLRERIIPYLCESGLDVNKLSSDRTEIIQRLMVYHVIDKRKRELDDIAKGT